jgi:hypothetical protein
VFWILVIVGTLIAVVLLSGLLVPILRGRGDDTLRATQDSLVANKEQIKEAIQQMHARDQILTQANATLDSILRTPPKVVYRYRPAPANASAPVLGDTESHDPASGDPMEALVPLPAYNALAKACGTARNACSADSAAKENVIAGQQTQIRLDSSLFRQQEALRARERRAATAAKIRDTGTGIGIGALLCLFFCSRL